MKPAMDPVMRIFPSPRSRIERPMFAGCGPWAGLWVGPSRQPQTRRRDLADVGARRASRAVWTPFPPPTDDRAHPNRHLGLALCPLARRLLSEGAASDRGARVRGAAF